MEINKVNGTQGPNERKPEGSNSCLPMAQSILWMEIANQCPCRRKKS